MIYNFLEERSTCWVGGATTVALTHHLLGEMVGQRRFGSLTPPYITTLLTYWVNSFSVTPETK
jgi:hypothetical protein